MNFRDRTLWITGASSGIGRATALAAAARGARVILSARRKDALEAVREACVDPERIRVLPLDLTDAEAREHALREAQQWGGGFDVLVHNAGIGQNAKAADCSLHMDREIMELNYFAPVALTKRALPYLRKRSGSQLVVVSSVVGFVAPPTRSAYAASKHALHGFFNSLRAEIARDGVSVSLVCPGYVSTGFRRLAPEKGGPRGANTPRGIKPDKCARAILRAIHKREREIYVGGTEVLSIYAQRWTPWLVAGALARFAPR